MADSAPTPELRDDPRLVLSSRGGTGLYDVALAATGPRGTWRVRWSADYFRRKDFFCCANATGAVDTHTRYRMVTSLGYSPLPWLELWTAVHASSNRNEREQANRQDPPNVFALGDTDLGIKFILSPRRHWFALALHHQTTVLSNAQNRNLGPLQATFDALFTLDFRDRLPRPLPLRFTLNAGWIFDNSAKLTDWTAIDDAFSREVMRFSLGTNVSRARWRLGIDAPFRIGGAKNWTLAPMFEHAWDFATSEDRSFSSDDILVGTSRGITLNRSQSWMNAGLRIISDFGLSADAAVQVAVVHPKTQYGSRLPPWQVLFGIGTALQSHSKREVARSTPRKQGPAPKKRNQPPTPKQLGAAKVSAPAKSEALSRDHTNREQEAAPSSATPLSPEQVGPAATGTIVAPTPATESNAEPKNDFADKNPTEAAPEDWPNSGSGSHFR